MKVLTIVIRYWHCFLNFIFQFFIAWILKFLGLFPPFLFTLYSYNFFLRKLRCVLVDFFHSLDFVDCIHKA